MKYHSKYNKSTRVINPDKIPLDGASWFVMIRCENETTVYPHFNKKEALDHGCSAVYEANSGCACRNTLRSILGQQFKKKVRGGHVRVVNRLYLVDLAYKRRGEYLDFDDAIKLVLGGDYPGTVRKAFGSGFW